MGLAIDREQFDPVDYRRFEERLDECLLAMGRLLERPGFGTGPTTLGAELELFLVDSQGRALPLNQVVRAEAADPRGGRGIDRFNLELNLTPAPLQGRPFAAFASELDQALSIVRRAAAWHGGRIVTRALGPGPLPGPQQRHPPAAPGTVPGTDRRGRPAGVGRRRRRPRGRPHLLPDPPAGRPGPRRRPH